MTLWSKTSLGTNDAYMHEIFLDSAKAIWINWRAVYIFSWPSAPVVEYCSPVFNKTYDPHVVFIRIFGLFNGVFPILVPPLEILIDFAENKGFTSMHHTVPCNSYKWDPKTVMQYYVAPSCFESVLAQELMDWFSYLAVPLCQELFYTGKKISKTLLCSLCKASFFRSGMNVSKITPTTQSKNLLGNLLRSLHVN